MVLFSIPRSFAGETVGLSFIGFGAAWFYMVWSMAMDMEWEMVRDMDWIGLGFLLLTCPMNIAVVQRTG